MVFLFFFLQLCFLFILSRFVTRAVSQWLYRVTHSEKATIYGMALLFFPGTLIHELAHALMALVLFVRIGRIEFFPQMQGNQVKLGSVAVAKTDPLRRMLIGVAPVLAGIAMLAFSGTLIKLLALAPLWEYILLGIIAFEVGNTMFSSQKDMEGTLAFVVTLLGFGITGYIVGIQIPENVLLWFQSSDVVEIVGHLNTALLVPFALNCVVLIVWGMYQSRTS